MTNSIHMNYLNWLLIGAWGLLLGNCGTSNNQTLWISGMKTECDAGAGTKQCLRVYRGEEVADAEWENFYANIEGFEFEEGYLRRVKVKTEEVSNPPADASSLRYVLVKELDRRADNRAQASGKWTLATLNGNPLNRMVTLPTLRLDLTEMRVSGNDGCNDYTGEIKAITDTRLTFGTIGATRKMCRDMQVPDAYTRALNQVVSYRMQDDLLVLQNETGEEILTFIAQN